MNHHLSVIVEDLAGKLLARKLVCATAESCTGGGIAQALTSVAGSSVWFDCGFVTYSNGAKQKLLGVDSGLISRWGAVSEQVAGMMALGAIDRSDAQVAVAVTGIAGPDGGSADKPVGTVAFGWLVPGTSEPATEMLRFEGDREGVRMSSVFHGIKGLVARL